MSTPEKEPIPIPKDFKIWYLAESRKEPTTEAYKEWKRRGQQLCFEVAYTEGYQDASEAAYRHLSSQPSPGLPWVKAVERLPEINDKEVFAFDALMEAKWIIRQWPDGGISCHSKNRDFLFKKDDPRFINNFLWLEETPSVQPIEGEQKPVFGCTYPNCSNYYHTSFKAPEAQPIADHVHVKLDSGAVATVSPDASTELLGALNTMAEKAMQMPVADKEVPEDINKWMDDNSEWYSNDDAALWRNGATAMYHKMQEEINDILMVHKSISDSYNELLPESIKTSANLIAARTEISTQAIQIAGLLASNRSWGEKYVELEKKINKNN